MFAKEAIKKIDFNMFFESNNVKRDSIVNKCKNVPIQSVSEKSDTTKNYPITIIWMSEHYAQPTSDFGI